MEPLQEVATKGKKAVAKLTLRSKIIKSIIQGIGEKKGEHIMSLDMRKIPEAVADFFIICEATNNTQLKGIADFVEEEVKKQCEESPYRVEGREGQQWILMDYVNVVVHIMLHETRNFYRLEDMWSDAVVTEHES